MLTLNPCVYMLTSDQSAYLDFDSERRFAAHMHTQTKISGSRCLAETCHKTACSKEGLVARVLLWLDFWVRKTSAGQRKMSWIRAGWVKGGKVGGGVGRTGTEGVKISDLFARFHSKIVLATMNEGRLPQKRRKKCSLSFSLYLYHIWIYHTHTHTHTHTTTTTTTTTTTLSLSRAVFHQVSRSQSVLYVLYVSYISNVPGIAQAQAY